MKASIVDAARELVRRFTPDQSGKVERLLAMLADYQRGWPPGHFYSPIPSLEQVRAREDAIWPPPTRQLAGIDLREQEQLELLDRLARFYGEQPWSDAPQNGLRYGFENPNFSYGESILLYALLRELEPARVIEIGSGHSSAATLDTNERFLGGAAKLTFIEPYPELLESLLTPADRASVEIIASGVQDVPMSVFESLQAGDVLFVDSTHVSKVGSDVNYIVFDVLPRLAAGVYVHVHDIYYPFEYPKDWVYQGRAWNEAYVLRAFLQYNDAFEIVLFGSFLRAFHMDTLSTLMPLVARNPGSSIWLRRTSSPGTSYHSQ